MLGNHWRIFFSVAVFCVVGISSAHAESPQSPKADGDAEATTIPAPTTVSSTSATPDSTTAATPDSSSAVTTPKVANTDSAEETLTTRQGKIACGAQDFTTTADDCCQSPLDDVFPLATYKDCMRRQDPRTDFLLNGIMMNKLQDRRHNELDYTGFIISRVFGPGVCFADCVFKKNNLHTKTGAVDNEKFLKYVTKGRSDPWKSILTEGFDMCKNYTKAVPVKDFTYRDSIEKGKRTCKTESIHMIQCMQVVVALNCPKSLPRTDENAKKCTETYGNLNKCVQFIDKNFGRTEYLKNYLKNKKNDN